MTTSARRQSTAPKNDAYRPLYTAAGHGHKRIVQALVAAKASVNNVRYF